VGLGRADAARKQDVEVLWQGRPVSQGCRQQVRSMLVEQAVAVAHRGLEPGLFAKVARLEPLEDIARQEAHGHNEGRIVEIEDQLSRADVIDVSKLSGKTVKFGATVTLINEDTDEKKKYQIVGDAEADVKEGRISISSPIARALIGKSKGDTVEVSAPGGAHSYEIIDVKFS
jgi:transcription elongation factor GreA